MTTPFLQLLANAQLPLVVSVPHEVSDVRNFAAAGLVKAEFSQGRPDGTGVVATVSSITSLGRRQLVELGRPGGKRQLRLRRI